MTGTIQQESIDTASRAPMVHELLTTALERHPDAPAVRDESAAWTYRDLDSFSRSVCAWLKNHGVRRGERVVVSLPNSRVLVGLLFGVVRYGAVFVPVSPDARPNQLVALIDDCRPVLVVQETADSETPSGSPRRTSVAELLAELPVPLPQPEADRAERSDIAMFMYTSGSSSRPKAVVCRHQQVAYAVTAVADSLPYRQDDVVYCRLPFSFDYGLYQIFLCARVGASLAVTGRQPEPAVLKFAALYGATVLPVVPTLATLILRLARRGRQLPPVRLITNTGAELTASAAEELRSTFPGAAVVFMYGMTECKRITIAAPDEDLRAQGSVGTALPGTRVDVVDGAKTVLPAGRSGQIVVRGPHLMDGYWQAPRATAERYGPHPVTGERALFTGDFGVIDSAGRLTFLGRNDDIFKRRGMRTSTAEIEAAALDVPGVVQAAVNPPGADGVLHLWVVSEAASATVLAGLAERLEPAKVPDHCWVRDRLPQTVHKKIDKQQLREAERNLPVRPARAAGTTGTAGTTT
ncbi:class I adenylate-forming enzyme family protein [Streptomyces sp. NPDC060035]|uniref:class I adenylate-forming enzyme family protein n=1 Tax=Streptomyces sp. NPDC060035 TaxID=3347044 RepID=UPI00369E6827